MQKDASGEGAGCRLQNNTGIGTRQGELERRARALPRTEAKRDKHGKKMEHGRENKKGGHAAAHQQRQMGLYIPNSAPR
jgi:hypothetical protein